MIKTLPFSFFIAALLIFTSCKKEKSAAQASLQDLKYELLTNDSLGMASSKFNYGEDIHFVLNETNLHETESIRYILNEAPCQSLELDFMVLDKDGKVVGHMVPDSVLCTLQLTIFTINPKAANTYTNNWKTKYKSKPNGPSTPINADLEPGSYTCMVRFVLDKQTLKPFTNKEEQDAFNAEERVVELKTLFEVI